MARSPRLAKANSVLNQQERLELLEQRVLYLETRLRQWDAVDVTISKVLSILDPARLGNSSLSCALTALLSATDNAPGPESYQAVCLEQPLATLLTGSSQS